MPATICYGRQDCHDLHSWGPGIRTCYVLHYIIRGKGTFINGGKSYALSAGESFVYARLIILRITPMKKSHGNTHGLSLTVKNMLLCLTVYTFQGITA